MNGPVFIQSNCSLPTWLGDGMVLAVLKDDGFPRQTSKALASSVLSLDLDGSKIKFEAG